jgi:hypothetical protein
MTLKKIIVTMFISLCIQGYADQKKRPRELQFYVNSHLTTTTLIEYNRNGNVLKLSSFEKNKLTDYARYNYNSQGRLLSERTFDFSNILIRVRKYFYDDDGFIKEEKVFSPAGKLIEYLIISYNSGKMQKIDYYKPDDNLYQTIEFNYTGDILNTMVFNKIGKYIMIMKADYDREMLLVGHSIKHSNADIKIETKYIYEDGYASAESLQLIFR